MSAIRPIVTVICILFVSSLGLLLLLLPDFDFSCTNSLSCNDNNKCTIDSCENGECRHIAKTCDQNLENLCLLVSCDDSTGECLTKSRECVPNPSDLCSEMLCDSGTGECLTVERNCTAEQMSGADSAMLKHIFCNHWSCDAALGCIPEPLPGQVCDLKHCINSTCSEQGLCFDSPLCFNNGNDLCEIISCVPDFSNPLFDSCASVINGTFCPELICSNRTCVNNTCDHQEFPGCCTRDLDCDMLAFSTSSGACTHHVCVNSTCLARGISDCCIFNSDCDDFDSCTVDVCNVTSRTCSHSALACCSVDSDCAVTTSCMTWACVNSSCAYEFASVNASCNNETWRTCDEANGTCDFNGTCTIADPTSNCPNPVGCASFICSVPFKECEFVPNVTACGTFDDVCLSAECLENGNCTFTNSTEGAECPPGGCVASFCVGGVCVANDTIPCVAHNTCDVEFCNVSTGVCLLNFTIVCESSTCVDAVCTGGECIQNDICTSSTVTSCQNDTQIACYVQLVNSSDVCYWAPDPTCPNMTRAAVNGSESSNFTLDNCTECCDPTSSTISSTSSVSAPSGQTSSTSSTSSTNSLSVATSSTSSTCSTLCCPEFICQCWDCVPSNITGFCALIATLDQAFSGKTATELAANNGTLQEFCVGRCIENGYLDGIWSSILFA